jgi:hypothetical protein
LVFVEAKADTSLFVYHRSADTMSLLLYIDDIILVTSHLDLLQRTTTALQWEFAMKDLGPLHHFLGISMEQEADNLFLHKHQYALNILERAGTTDCKPCATLMDTREKVSFDAGAPINDPTVYRSLVGTLQYLTFTGPDIYAILVSPQA